MDSAEFVVSVETLYRVVVFLLYASVFLVSYWMLIPRLSSTSKRVASAMLAAQVLVITLSLEIRTTSEFTTWLLDLDREWNLPSTLASVQLALVSGVMLAAAWLAKARPAGQRRYLFAIGLLFLFLAVDEYFLIHDLILNWANYYIVVGAAVAASTVIVGARSPRNTWIWHICLLTGLAMSAAGAVGIESLPTTCGSVGIFRFDQCLRFFFIEESLEFLGIWLTLVAALGQFSAVAPTPQPRVRIAVYTMPALWLFLLFLASLSARLELRLLARPALIDFESDVVLHGVRVDSGQDSATIRLYTSATQGDYAGQLYSTRLVDQERGGRSVAASDSRADFQFGFWLFGPDYVPVYRQTIEVAYPPQMPVNRALWIVLTLWRRSDGEYTPQAVRTSDQHLLDETQIVLGELVLPATSAASQASPMAVFENGFTLAAVDLPESAQSGETMPIRFSWRSDVDSLEDHSQFLHLGHEKSGSWWAFDQHPLGARLPTRLWYKGLADSEIWQVPLPVDLAVGRYTVYTGLYRTGDKARVPASDADGIRWQDARVPLGILIVE